MSYCRWSCMDGYSDVYVYANVHGGWTTHVAGRRIPEGAPPDADSVMLKFMDNHPGDTKGAADAYLAAQKCRREWDANHPHFAIDHPEAGVSFNHDSPGACADNLERLRGEGFTVPDWAIETLREEHLEMYA